jgi:NAD-dependent SIR2 family protein deacetylase
MSEVVFILGAGASKEAGAPLMADFLDKADELRKHGKVNQFKPDFDCVFNAISALQPVHSKAQLDLDNIESVFAAFEMARLINKLPGVRSDDIKSLLISIRKLIFVTLDRTITYPVRDEHIYPNDSYNALAKLLSDFNDDGRQNRCSIITFNYDLALDYAFHFNKYLSADYCLSETTKPGDTPLMKLHGSLNWARCSKCGKIIPWDIHAFFQEFHHPFLEESKFVCLDLASKLSSSSLKHCGQNVKPDPVIVPPTWNKTQHHQDLSKVWSRAARELSDAENIFVSGYSLTESDLFFRYLFALGSVGQSRIKRFWVFDPDEQNIVRPRFENLIGSGTRARFRFEKLKFRDAINIISREFLRKH